MYGIAPREIDVNRYVWRRDVSARLIHKAPLLSFYVLLALAVANSAARADESANIDTKHFAMAMHGQDIADLMHDLLNREVDNIPLAAR